MTGVRISPGLSRPSSTQESPPEIKDEEGYENPQKKGGEYEDEEALHGHVEGQEDHCRGGPHSQQQGEQHNPGIRLHDGPSS